MKVVLIIQARMGSSRLPGKSLMPLAGKSLIGHILERVKRCTRLDEIILAIPNTSENDILAQEGIKNDAVVFRGSEDNVLDRYIKAAKSCQANIVVRLPADNATPEPIEIDKIVNHHLSLEHPGFTSNLAEIRNSRYPDGIGAEVFNFEHLVEASQRKPTAPKMEHIHLNFYDYTTYAGVDEKWCPINTISCPNEYARPDIVLDINTMDQYLYMLELYQALYPRNPDFSIRDIVDWHDNRLNVCQREFGAQTCASMLDDGKIA